MIFIKPSVEIWEQGNTLEDIWKHIARCTRVCYQSTPKENGETDEHFVKRVILKGHLLWRGLDFDSIHGAMLEHGTVYLTIPITNVTGDEVNSSLVAIVDRYRHNKYSKVVSSDKYVYITTNLRVIYENDWLDDLEYIDTPRFHHKRITVSFTTNIGVSHEFNREFNRHRVNSMAEESTRYCNYNLDKYDKRITFALPSWIDINETEIQACRTAEVESDMYAYMRVNTERSNNWNAIEWYLYALSTSAFAYKKLIQLGWKPQQAREVLPLATKTQLIHTAFVDDWKHFFALMADGVSGLPHPNVALVAKPLKEEFIKRNYI